MTKLTFSGLPEAEVEIKGYVFKVKGMNRRQALEYLQLVKQADIKENDLESVFKNTSLMNKVIDFCVKDEKAKELIEEELTFEEFMKLVSLILDLSGFGVESKNF